MKPVCVPCERFMRLKKSGFYFLEGMPEHGSEGQGKGAAGWKPYKLWSGDLYECPGCRASTIVGVGFQPVSEHYLPGFAEVVKVTGADRLLVKDC